jgi:hypothetical protein
MRSHCVTVDFEDDGTDNIEDLTFSSNQSLLGNDVVIIDSTRLLRHYSSTLDSRHHGQLRLSELEPHAERLRRDIARRSIEIAALLASGAVIVVTTPPDTTAWVKALDQTGAARDRVILEPLNPLSILPISFKSETGEGKAVVSAAAEPFKAFFDANAGNLRYDGFLTLMTGGAALAFVRSTKKAVSAHFTVSNGHVIFLPRSTISNRYSPDGERLDDRLGPYFDSILALSDAVRGAAAFELPPWTGQFRVPGEGDQLRALELTQRKLDDLELQRVRQEERLSETRALKRLFCADGPALEAAVEDSLRELGFTTEAVEPNRADIIARHGRSVIAVEVKGVTKSAAEHHAAELEKWISSYNDGHGKRPKGILVVNAFRNKSLAERAAFEAFPNQMLKWSKAREHCLITGLQLLGVTLRARAHKSDIPKLRRSLLSCIGRYPDFRDYKTFLVESAP